MRTLAFGLPAGIEPSDLVFISEYVAIIAVTSAAGGQLGGMIGRRLRPMLLRVIIIAVGIAALVKFLMG